MKNKFILFLTKMLTILCLFSMVLSLNAFQFNEDGEFTLLQLTDFHSCEKESRDLKTWKLWDMLISKAPPDLVILSGDAVSGYAGRYENGTVMDGFFKSCWTNFSSYFENKGLHYAYILGNHDDEGDYNRSQIIELDKTSSFSVLGMSESTQMNNTGNYWIPIYSRKNSSAIAVIIWMFDTHDTNCSGIPSSWGCIEHDQLEWYDRESKKIKDLYGTNIQHIAYLHIPIPEYMALYNTEDIYSLYGEPVSCAKVNTGFFSHVLQNGDISAMFVGHDHQNDFGGYYHGVELVYGRKSGYGGYGNIAGGRIVNFKEVEGPDGSTIVTRNHYVIQEDGSIEQNSPLKARKGAIQASCVAAMNRNLIHEESDDEKKMIIEEFLGFSWGKEERKQFLIERIYEDKN